MKEKGYVLVLGSGKSINQLNSGQKEFLSNCEVRLAINKFSAFYKIPGLLPTHVYFQDTHHVSSILMLKYIFKLFRNDKIKNITFILSPIYRGKLFRTCLAYNLKRIVNKIKEHSRNIFITIGRKTLKNISLKFFNNYVYIISKLFKSEQSIFFNLIPKSSEIHYINIEHCENRENFWSSSLDKALFHFKGSFSSVLNYISICFPGKTILLLGVDFDSPEYFFEEELKKLKFNTRDWTYKLTKENKKHYSIINTEGVTIDDALPFMLSQLSNSCNKIYSLNKESYLVKKGYIEFRDFDEI